MDGERDGSVTPLRNGSNHGNFGRPEFIERSLECNWQLVREENFSFFGRYLLLTPQLRGYFVIPEHQ